MTRLGTEVGAGLALIAGPRGHAKCGDLGLIGSGRMSGFRSAASDIMRGA